MTTFEYFKIRYDANHDYMVKCISKEVPVDSFHFVQVAWRNCFGGTVDVDPWNNINDVSDNREMRDAGFTKAWTEYGTRRHHVALTAKGLRAFYKAMF